MTDVFKLIEANGLTLHGDIEHFAELVRADERDEDELIIRYHEMTIKRLEKRIEELTAQPEQEPVAWEQFHEHLVERNFCPRCGKRTADLTTIHTCTPPREKDV